MLAFAPIAATPLADDGQLPESGGRVQSVFGAGPNGTRELVSQNNTALLPSKNGVTFIPVFPNRIT